MASSAILSSEEDKNLYSCCICHFQLISNIVLNQTGMKITFVVCVLKSWRIFSTSIYLVLLWCVKAFLDLKSLSQWLQGMLIRSNWPNDLPQWGLLHECSRPPFHKLYILFALHCLWLASLFSLIFIMDITLSSSSSRFPEKWLETATVFPNSDSLGNYFAWCLAIGQNPWVMNYFVNGFGMVVDAWDHQESLTPNSLMCMFFPKKITG